jgi:hypothetical protein
VKEYQLVFPDTIKEDTIGAILFFIGPSALPWFNEILQRGFFMINPVGISIEEFLTKQIGLSREYIGHKISTVLLDGKIVHDIGSAIIKRGSVIAFSSALPGFVGVSLRRGTLNQSLCGPGITEEINSPDSKERGVLCVKLYNLPMIDLGPSFMKRGILLRSAGILEFLKTQPDAFWRDCSKILLDGKKIDPVSLGAENMTGRYEWLRLSIHLPDE